MAKGRTDTFRGNTMREGTLKSGAEYKATASGHASWNGRHSETYVSKNGRQLRSTRRSGEPAIRTRKRSGTLFGQDYSAVRWVHGSNKKARAVPFNKRTLVQMGERSKMNAGSNPK